MAGEQLFLLRPMLARDLDVVREWRNDPQTRRYMISRHVISREEHQLWFERCAADPSRRLYVLDRNAQPLGFAQLSGVASGGTAEWGFHVAPQAPRGTGTELCSRVLMAAFQKERLYKVLGKTLSSNERSRRLHLRLGFTEEGRVGEQPAAGEEYRDIVCYGILARNFTGSLP